LGQPVNPTKRLANTKFSENHLSGDVTVKGLFNGGQFMLI